MRSYKRYESKNLRESEKLRCGDSSVWETEELRNWLKKVLEGNMRGPRQFAATVVLQVRHRQTSTLTALRHDTLRPPQNHKSRQNQGRGQPLLRLHWFSPLPLPRQAEPKQKSQHEKRQRKGKQHRKERKYTLLFTVPVRN